MDIFLIVVLTLVISFLFSRWLLSGEERVQKPRDVPFCVLKHEKDTEDLK